MIPRRQWFVWTLAGASVVAGVAVAAHWRPGCRPDAALRAAVLRATPLGSDTPLVRRAIAERGWPGPTRSPYGYIVPAEHGGTGLPTIVGASSLTVDLPDCLCPLSGPLIAVSTQVRWGFDSAGHVMAVDIRRSFDGP